MADLDHPAATAGEDPGIVAPGAARRADMATVFLGLLALIAVGAVLRTLSELIIPLVVAFFLSFLLWPLIAALVRRRVPGVLAVVAALLVVAAVVGLAGMIVTRSVSSFSIKVPVYQARVQVWADRAAQAIGPAAAELKKREHLEKVGAVVAGTAMGAVGTIVSLASSLALIVVYLLFILFGRLESRDRLARAFAPGRAEQVRRAFENVDHQVIRYLGAKTLINLVVGVLFGLACLGLGVDFPVLWGFLAFVINYIPTIGSLVAPVPPVLIALLLYPDALWRPVALGVALLAITTVMFNAVEPKVLGDKLGLSPLVVMFALLFFGWLWGIWGMVLSVPLAAIVKILLDSFETTHPFAVLME